MATSEALRLSLDQPAPPRAARRAVALLFFANGAALASWIPRIPAAQEQLGLSVGVLGIALLGAPIGAVIAMPLTGALIGRFGSRAVVRTAALCLCASLPLPILAPNLPLFMLALAVLGASNAAMDVSMNAHGVAVERGYHRPIMSSFHAMYSIGGLVGAGAAGLIAGAGVDARPHLVGSAVVLAGLVCVATPTLLTNVKEHESQGPAFVRPSAALLALGIIAFCSMLGEGAMADWSAVYLRSGMGASAAFAAAGFAAFSLAMALGRIFGDRLTLRFGPAMIVRAGGALAALGLAVALVVDAPAAAVVGFACVGAGLSCVVPNAFSAAGRAPGLAPGAGIAAVSTTGYFGFLVGPPVIGLVAARVTLRGALGVVVLLSAIMALLAGSVAGTMRPSTRTSAGSDRG